MTNQAHKGLDVSVGLGWGAFCNCLHFILTQFNTVLGDMMSQVVDLVLEEFTLGAFEPEVVLTKSVKDNTQLVQVFLFCL